MRVFLTSILLASAATGLTQKTQDQSEAAGHDDAAALTIYNQSFAVVRQTLPLDLKSGTNQLEIHEHHGAPGARFGHPARPESGRDLHILEQNYRGDVASQGRLLALYEGKTIDFCPGQRRQPQADAGKIIRHRIRAALPGIQRLRSAVLPTATGLRCRGNGEPIIEIDGKLQFGLPGQPIFPLSNDTILKPTSHGCCKVTVPATQRRIQLVTGGMSWHADYNVVALGERQPARYRGLGD